MLIGPELPTSTITQIISTSSSANIEGSLISILNNSAVGAFLGSFSAFLFGIIAYNYTKKRERYKTHHDAVVKAEQLTNRQLNEISGNLFLLKGAIDTYAKKAFSENVLSTLENPDLLIDFYNLEILNRYLDYQSLVEKVNHDMKAWNKSNNRLFSAALSGSVSHEDINTNRESLSERTRELVRHLEDLMEEAYSFGAYVREFLKLDKRGRFGNLNVTEKIKVLPENEAKERELFVKQSQETMKKDREGRLKKYNLRTEN